MDTPIDYLQSGILIAQLLLLGVAAKVAYGQLNHARALREDQARPFVVIDLESPVHTLFDLVVKNIGSTMAREVTFRFDPPAESTMEDVDLDKIKMFRDGISTLPPGKEFRTLFEQGPVRSKSDLPDVYIVTVRYLSADGETEYEERIDLDFGIYWDRMMIGRRKDVHDLHDELQRIRKDIKKWSPGIGGGLLTRTPFDVEKMNAEFIRESDERHARYEAQQAEAEAAKAADSTDDDA